MPFLWSKDKGLSLTAQLKEFLSTDLYEHGRKVNANDSAAFLIAILENGFPHYHIIVRNPTNKELKYFSKGIHLNLNKTVNRNFYFACQFIHELKHIYNKDTEKYKIH